MTRFYITHTDETGETNQLTGAYEAATPEAAIAQMLSESQADDDGQWQAHEVKSDADIIPYSYPLSGEWSDE